MFRFKNLFIAFWELATDTIEEGKHRQDMGGDATTSIAQGGSATGGQEKEEIACPDIITIEEGHDGEAEEAFVRP